MEEFGMLELARELGIAVRYWHVMDLGRGLLAVFQLWYDVVDEAIFE